MPGPHGACCLFWRSSLATSDGRVQFRGVYPCLPLATNAPRTIWRGIFLKFNKFQYTKIHIIISVKWLFLSEYTKINVGCSFAPDPTRGAYSAPPDPLAGFKGAASRQEGNGGEGRTRERREERKGEELREWGRNGKGGSWGIAPWLLGRIDAPGSVSYIAIANIVVCRFYRNISFFVVVISRMIWPFSRCRFSFSFFYSTSPLRY